MSYEGSTSRNSKYGYMFMGSASVVYPGMTTSHRVATGPYVIYRNTFSTTFIRLIGDGGATTTTLSHNLQRTLNNPDHLTNRSMWYTNSTVSERWYTPLSKGLASCTYTSMDNFSTTTSTAGAIRLEMEI